MTSVNDLSPAIASHQRQFTDPTPVAPVEAPAEDGLEDQTRVELYETAQELDIPGRSSMDRDELIEAIELARADQE